MSIDVGALASRHNDPSTSKLTNILSAAVNTQTSSPSQLAAALDGLYTPDQDAESLLWTLWTLYIDVARQVPAADDARQTLLVSAVQELKKHTRGTVEAWGGQAALWADLPFFGPCMREAWNGGHPIDPTCILL